MKFKPLPRKACFLNAYFISACPESSRAALPNPTALRTPSKPGEPKSKKDLASKNREWSLPEIYEETALDRYLGFQKQNCTLQ